MDGINQFSSLYCSAEWHIEQHCPKLASSIYNLAFRVAAKSGRFSVSYPHLAAYFDTTERTIRRAVHGLRDIEFFKRLSNEAGHACVYQPVHHRDWSQFHPGKCLERIEKPAYWEKDILGQALFAECDGRIKFFYPNVLKGLRGTGFSDVEIVQHMKTFRRLDTPPIGESWTRGFVSRFFRYLKNERN